MKAKLAFLIISVLLSAGNRTFARQRQSDGATATGQKPPTATLARIRSIYIAPMPNGFDQYLAAELLKRLPKGVSLVQNKDRADAVLEGVDENSTHGISRTVNQVFGVGGSASGAVRLLSGDGQILWATEKSDHTIPIYGTWREHGMPKVAASHESSQCAADGAKAREAEEMIPERARPGIVAAGMAQRQWDTEPAYRKRAEKAISLGFLQLPRFVADAVVFLCSNASGYMTGSTLLVDGGCSLYPMD